jgi:hypothetical protein
VTTAKGNIEIPFETDGTPNKQSVNKKTGLSLWRYEVPDFNRMALSNSEMEAQKKKPTFSKLFE